MDTEGSATITWRSQTLPTIAITWRAIALALRQTNEDDCLPYDLMGQVSELSQHIDHMG